MSRHPESGYPSEKDYYASGSEHVAKDNVTIPSGFSTSAPTAANHPHHESRKSHPVGVPMSSYSPHRNDKIFSTASGHKLIFGEAPGRETVLIQAKSGASIELDNSGAIKLVSQKGLHLGIGSDGHLVLQGDFSVVASSIKFKAGSIIFDCNDLQWNVKGDLLSSVGGDANYTVYGDNATSINGDSAHTIGGNERKMVAGDVHTQTTGNHDHHVKGNFSTIGNKDVKIHGQKQLELFAKEDMKISSSTKDVKIKGKQTFVHGDSLLALKASSIISQPAIIVSGSSVDDMSPTRPQVPSEKEILKHTSDVEATEGHQLKVFNPEQIYSDYDESGDPPGPVLAKLKEHGFKWPPDGEQKEMATIT